MATAIDDTTVSERTPAEGVRVELLHREAGSSSAPTDSPRAAVHIGADARLSIDLRGTAADSGRVTTDITCPRCAGPLTVDDLDTALLAAQLRCPSCRFTFLQRLRDEHDRRRSTRLHRWTNGAPAAR